MLNGLANKNQSFEISGASIGITKRLRVPDDYFRFSQALSYQYYNLNNYYTGLFTFGDGRSNNIAYTASLARNNTFINIKIVEPLKKRYCQGISCALSICLTTNGPKDQKIPAIKTISIAELFFIICSIR